MRGDNILALATTDCSSFGTKTFRKTMFSFFFKFGFYNRTKVMFRKKVAKIVDEMAHFAKFNQLTKFCFLFQNIFLRCREIVLCSRKWNGFRQNNFLRESLVNFKIFHENLKIASPTPPPPPLRAMSLGRRHTPGAAGGNSLTIQGRASVTSSGETL